jgi:Protein of unknown function (DUF3617)
MKLPSLLATVAAVLAPLVATSADKLNVRTGLWEVTSVSEISGMPPLPKDMLDKMTPEQRKQMELAMREETAKGPRTDTDRECITQKDIEHPFENVEDDEDCQHTIVQTTRTSQEVRLTCTGEHKGSGTFRVSTPTPETMTGTLDLRMGEGNNIMTVKSQLKGRWIGPDCGDEDDDAEDSGDQDEHEEDE